MTASIPLDEVFHFDVITSSPTTGAATDADSTPTFAVYEETTDTDIGVGGNLTKRTSLTGNYRGSFTMSAANGFEVGKFYSVIASATVGAVAGKAVAAHIRCVAAEAVAGKPKVDVDAWLGTAAATPTVAGVPEVDVTHWIGTAAATPTVAGIPEVDVTHWIGTAAATPTVAGVPEVDITHFGGSAGTFASGRPEVNASHIAGNTTAATILSRIYGAACVTGTADSGTTSSMVDAALTQADGGYWTGGWIVFTSGNISGQCRRIVSFTPGTDTVNFSPNVTQAVSTQNYVIIPSTNAADDVWEATTADYASAGTFGEAMSLPAIAGAVWNEDVSGHLFTTNFGQYINDISANMPTPAAVADAVWDELTSGHNGGAGVAGSFGEVVISTQGAVSGLPDASTVASAVLTSTMSESYAADGSEMTLAQALYAIQQYNNDRALAGVTMTVKKIDGTTTAYELTVDSATDPTTIARTA